MSLYTLTIDLLAKTGSLEKGMGRAAHIVERDSRAIQRALGDNVTKGADDAAAGFRRATIQMVSFGAAMAGVRATIGRADEWTNLNNRLRLVTDGHAAFSAAQADVIRIATAARQPLGATAELYQRIAMNQDELGLSGASLARVVETISKTMVISGTSAAGAQAALVQLGQAFASGILRGEELNSVMEQAPALAQAIAAGLNVPIGKLREMGKAGELTAQQVIGALSSQAGAVDAAFGSMSATVDQAMTGFNNQLQVMVGRADEATGASQMLAAGIQAIGANMPAVTAALGAFAAVKVTQAITSRMTAMTASIQVERAQAIQALASARALEARTAAQVVDTGMMLRAATTARARLIAEAALTKSAQQHAAARLQLAAAEKAATAAGAGTFARGGAALLGALGGPAGIAAMVAVTAASWLAFRDNTDSASQSMVDFNDEAGRVVASFNGMNKAMQADAVLRLSDDMDAAAKTLGETIANMAQEADFTDLLGTFGPGLQKLQADFEAGKISADAFANAVSDMGDGLVATGQIEEVQRRGLIAYAAQVGNTAREIERKSGILDSFQDSQRAAAAATDAATTAMRAQEAQAAATGKAVEGFMKRTTEEIKRGQIELARIQGGDAAGMKQQFGQFILDSGGVEAFKPADLQAVVAAYRARRAQVDQIAAASEAASGSKKQQADAKKAAEQQRESLARYTEQAELAAAALSGPLDEAQMRHVQTMVKLNDELAKGNIRQSDANALMAESATAYAKTAKEIEKAQNAPKALLDTMTGEIRLLGMTGRARELYRRQLENERDMREAINRANEAGAEINDEVTASLLRQARGWAETSIAAEEASAAAESWTRVAMDGVGGVADTFADLFSGGLKEAKDFFTSLKDVFKRGLWDVMRNMMQTNFVAPMQKALESAMSGFGSAGTSGQGFGSVLSKAFSSWLGSGAGAANVATTGYGQAINGLAQTYGGTGVGTTAGMGMAGLGAAIPIAGAIIAGMTLNNSAYAQGFKIQGQTNNVSEYLVKNGHAIIALAHSTVSVTDKMLQKIGLSSKTASMISGSSLSTKAFGHAAPKVQQSGIQGSVGFGGFEGESFADIKAKGGWFRSDKRWTETGEVNADIDRAFGMASARAGVGAKELAKQVGVDVAQALGAVKIDLGKMVLDADPEKAREQVEAKLSEIMEGLTGEAVKALGFGKLLEPAYAATDVMTALSAAMELSRNTAEALGRAINDAERAGIGRAVGWFKELSQINGTEMADEIARVVGVVGDYGALMADIDTQLMTGGLSNYQQQALAIERAYRQQAKAANDYAKALGLSGARAEDLAKIEELRAVGMGKLQAQMEAEKAASLNNLALSDLSPLRDDQKLAEAMKQLQDAVTAGDIGAANSASQAALGFGRNLYASGRDYSSLYDQVTGMLGGMQMGDLALEDGTTMGALADTIEASAEHFSKAIFELAAGMQKETTAATNEVRDAVNRGNELLDQLLQETRKGVGGGNAGRLRDELNRQQVAVR